MFVLENVKNKCQANVIISQWHTSFLLFLLRQHVSSLHSRFYFKFRRCGLFLCKCIVLLDLIQSHFLTFKPVFKKHNSSPYFVFLNEIRNQKMLIAVMPKLDTQKAKMAIVSVTTWLVKIKLIMKFYMNITE